MSNTEIKGKWTKEKAWEWYAAQKWICGYNGYPSNCVNRIALWQEYNHSEVMAQLEYEFALARETGFSAVRAILQFEVWLYQHDSFMQNLEDYFCLADKHGMRVMLTLGNDCLVPKALYQKPHFGEQKVDWGYHSGIKKGPHAGGHTGPGYALYDEPEYAVKFLEMVDELAQKYAHDPRLHIWDIWNEPGNSGRNELSLELMERSFETIRSYNQIQPLTAASWKYVSPGQARVTSAIELRALELSDIISFHCYEPVAEVLGILEALEADYGRPILNTEWLNRNLDCNISEILPVFYAKGVGSYHWGLIQGFSQTYEPVLPLYKMAETNPRIDLKLWMHDLYHFNGMPYDKKEVELFKRLSALAEENARGSAAPLDPSLRNF